MPFPIKLLIALVVVVLVFTHLPWILVALLVYLFVIRRFAHRHPRPTRGAGADLGGVLRPRWRG